MRLANDNPQKIGAQNRQRQLETLTKKTSDTFLTVELYSYANSNALLQAQLSFTNLRRFLLNLFLQVTLQK